MALLRIVARLALREFGDDDDDDGEVAAHGANASAKCSAVLVMAESCCGVGAVGVGERR